MYLSISNLCSVVGVPVSGPVQSTQPPFTVQGLFSGFLSDAGTNVGNGRGSDLVNSKCETKLLTTI